MRALPDDGNRYEVVDGELLATPGPSWQHQRGAQRLFLRLHPYVAANAVGYAMIAPAHVEFGSDRMVEPDRFVVPLVGGRVPRKVTVASLATLRARGERTVFPADRGAVAGALATGLPAGLPGALG